MTQPAPSPRFLLVKVEAGLPSYRWNGLCLAIKQHPGVEQVTDLAAISQATLDVILLKPEPLPPKWGGRKSPYNAKSGIPPAQAATEVVG